MFSLCCQMKFSQLLISILSETVALPNPQRKPGLWLFTRWDSLWFERQFSHYWFGFQWPGFCRHWQPLWGWHHSDCTMKQRRKYRVSVESLSCELLPPAYKSAFFQGFSNLLSLRDVTFWPLRTGVSATACVNHVPPSSIWTRSPSGG